MHSAYFSLAHIEYMFNAELLYFTFGVSFEIFANDSRLVALGLEAALRPSVSGILIHFLIISPRDLRTQRDIPISTTRGCGFPFNLPNFARKEQTLVLLCRA